MDETGAKIPPRPPPRPPAQHPAPDARVPSAVLSEIQFGLWPNKAAEKLSVIEDKIDVEGKDRKAGITTSQGVYDSRLGLPNKEKKCPTCTGTERGDCDSVNSCDGHFGHIALPSYIYHPHYIRHCVKLLSSICLGCSRVLEKKKRKNILDEVFQDNAREGLKKDFKRKRKGSDSGVPNRKRKRAQKPKDFTNFFMSDFGPGITSQDLPDTLSMDFSDTTMFRGVCKEEPIEFEDSYLSRLGREGPEMSNRAQTPGNTTSPNRNEQRTRAGAENQSVVCNHCSGSGGNGVKYPKMKVRLVGKVIGRKGRVDTIKLIVDEKAGPLPTDFWMFVNGHPNPLDDKKRTLLPREALKILKKIPEADHGKLNMDQGPGAFIINAILVSPNCNRLVMEDWSSTMQPKVFVRKGRQNDKIEALIRKARQIIPRIRNVDRDFEDVEQDAEELQLAASRHYRTCKIVEYRHSTGEEIEETGGSLELKWLKAHVLAKRSNFSARTVISGDPSIKVEEIGIPREIAHNLTVDETVNSYNIRKWQKFIDNYMKSSPESTIRAAPLIVKRRREPAFRDLSEMRRRLPHLDRRKTRFKLEVGDTVSHSLKDGDLVIANRPPSLHKHSLIALKAKILPVSTFTLNPLICTPFEADFDGDALHIFVPQSLESKVETEGLLTVSQQMICPQGGQPLIGLTQDSLLGCHLLTRGPIFLRKADMQQLCMFHTSRVPMPAIVKAPKRKGPLWTGMQVFSMSLPNGLNFGSFRPRSQSGASGWGDALSEDVLIRGGELLTSKGTSRWLERSARGIVRAVVDHAGPVAAVDHLNHLQTIVNQWLQIHGFSVGFRDFSTGADAEARRTMHQGIQKSLKNAHVWSLKQILQLDRQVQHRILFPAKETSDQKSEEEHQGCFGLLLGETRTDPKIAALQGVAIEAFVSVNAILENLVTGYMDEQNSLLSMVRSGSKGSVAKLTQQVGSLGLQLYKGLKLLPIQSCNKAFGTDIVQESNKLNVFSSGEADSRRTGYWESRGVIQSGYLDGLNPIEFLLDATSSRFNTVRQGIEEPNQILKNLMLCLRDIQIEYDGTARHGRQKSVIQFEYGKARDGGHEEDLRQDVMSISSTYPVPHEEETMDPGDPVGVLAATAIAEPAYNVKMQSLHQSQVMGIAPIQLLKEVLFGRCGVKNKLSDRRCILRLPDGFGKEQKALEVQTCLQKITLEMITRLTMIQYKRVDGKFWVKNATNKDIPSRPIKRRSCWVGHLHLCKNTIDEQKLNLDAIVERLNRTHDGDVEGAHNLYFLFSAGCDTTAHSPPGGPCIFFFPVVAKDVAVGPMKGSKSSALLDAMKSVILPDVLKSTIRGSDDLESVRIVWEDSGSASRPPRETLLAKGGGPVFAQQAQRMDRGELVIEVITKTPKGVGNRAYSWRMVKEACVPVMHLIDWPRSNPYSISEIYSNYGVEASRRTILKRLTVATKNMGKPVHQQHLTLVADTVTYSGKVLGVSAAGYREFCRAVSISTPFTEASFQYPRKVLIEAAVAGISESIAGGVLTSAVWGRRIPVGTGMSASLIIPDSPIDDRQSRPVNSNDGSSFKIYRIPHLKQSKVVNGKFSSNTKRPLEKSAGAKASECLKKFNNEVPSANVKVPSANVKVPSANIKVPSSNIEVPNANIEVLNANIEVLNANIEVPSANIEIRSVNIAVPGANFEVPCANIEVPSADIEVPSADNEVPIANIKVSSTNIEVATANIEALSDIIDVPISEADTAILKVNDPRRVSWSAPQHNGTGKSIAQRLVARRVNGTKADPVVRRTKAGVGLSERFIDKLPRGLRSDSENGTHTHKVHQFTYPTNTNVNSQKVREKVPIRDNHVANGDKAKRNPASTSPPGASNDSPEHECHTSMQAKLRFLLQKRQGNLSPPASLFNALTQVYWMPESSSDRLQEDLHLVRDQIFWNSRYRVGDKVSKTDKRMILEEVLAYHPRRLEKIGCGVEHIVVDYHLEHRTTKCFHIIRTDESRADFSYLKCLENRIVKLASKRKHT